MIENWGVCECMVLRHSQPMNLPWWLFNIELTIGEPPATFVYKSWFYKFPNGAHQTRGKTLIMYTSEIFEDKTQPLACRVYMLRRFTQDHCGEINLRWIKQVAICSLLQGCQDVPRCSLRAKQSLNRLPQVVSNKVGNVPEKYWWYVILLMVQQSSKLTSWGNGSLFTFIYRVSKTSQVVCLGFLNRQHVPQKGPLGPWISTP